MLTFLLAAALVAGPHSAGYRAELVRDTTRGARAVYVQAWYPARACSAPFAYREYVTGYEPRRAASIELHEWAAKRYGAPADAMERLFASPARACRDAAPASGTFPLILYGGGAGMTIDDNARLGEHFASHGFIFAAVPAPGTLDAAGLETHARDMELALDWSRRLPVSDRVIAGGFSWGGAAAIVLANRQNVDGVFLLDSSTTAKRFAPLVAGAPFFNPERLTVPILDLHRQDDTVTYDVLDRFRYAERWSFEMSEPAHADFTVLPMLYGGESEWIAKMLLAFVRGSREWPPTGAYRVTLRHRTAIAAPPDAAALEQLARKDIAAAAQTYERLRAGDPEASVLAPDVINRIGYALLRDDAAAAREVFLWNVRAHPEDAGWLDSLGDALLETNERDCARAVFARVAEMTGPASLRERALRELAALGDGIKDCKYLEGTNVR
jgi:hypothetical protein